MWRIIFPHAKCEKIQETKYKIFIVQMFHLETVTIFDKLYKQIHISQDNNTQYQNKNICHDFGLSIIGSSDLFEVK